MGLAIASKAVPRFRFPLVAIGGAALLALFLAAGCRKIRYVDAKPLEKAGMDFYSIEAVKGMDPTEAELAEVAKAKMGGLTDNTCVELMRIARNQKQPVKFADAADGLVQAGMKESEILELANIKQLGGGYGELQAMRLIGLSDAVVMEVARRHAAGQQALSGVSLARLKDSGLTQAAVFELVRRGVRDDQVAGIVAMRRARATEADIMRRYPPIDPTPPVASTSTTPAH